MTAPRITFPTRGLASKSFRYRESFDTDLKATFARERKRLAAEQRAQEAQQQQPLDLAADNVRPLTVRGAK